MIGLGVIPVTQPRSVIESRNKVMQVVLELSNDTVTATRIATATSQMARSLSLGRSGRIEVALEATDHRCNLILTFTAGGWLPPADVLVRFFPHAVHTTGKDGELSVRSVLRLLNTNPVTAAKRNQLITIGQQKSRDELMAEVQAKNIELEDHRAHLEETVTQRTSQLAREKENSDRLLHMIIPTEIAAELLSTGRVRPRRHDGVAVLFCDIAGFTPYCRTREPEEIVENLHQLFTAFEEYSLEFQLEKIKTIGDAFMAACGLLSAVSNPVENCVRCALKMIEAAPKVTVEWQMRVGIHFGPIVAGVLGSRKQQYDLWGDTVNVAARMESHGVPGSIALSESAWAEISDIAEAELLQRIHVKGLGEQSVFLFRRFREDIR